MRRHARGAASRQCTASRVCVARQAGAVLALSHRHNRTRRCRQTVAVRQRPERRMQRVGSSPVGRYRRGCSVQERSIGWEAGLQVRGRSQKACGKRGQNRSAWAEREVQQQALVTGLPSGGGKPPHATPCGRLQAWLHAAAGAPAAAAARHSRVCTDCLGFLVFGFWFTGWLTRRRHQNPPRRCSSCVCCSRNETSRAGDKQW